MPSPDLTNRWVHIPNPGPFIHTDSAGVSSAITYHRDSKIWHLNIDDEIRETAQTKCGLFIETPIYSSQLIPLEPGPCAGSPQCLACLQTEGRL